MIRYTGGQKPPKYHAKKVTVGGKTFDSRKEASRWAELRLLERAGKITELRRQVSYVLIPVQRDDAGKLLERACVYKADFVYCKDGKTIVEDVKGMRTPEYIIKRKLMLQVYGIRIKET